MRRCLLLAWAMSLVVLFLSAPAALAGTNPQGWHWPTGSGSTGGYLRWLGYNSAYHGYHLAQDFKARENASVVALGDGTVVRASMSVGGYGLRGKPGGAVVIRHRTASGSAFLALYGHLKNLKVKAGDKVTAGTVIGKIGPFAPTHLHFGIHPGSSLPTNPWRGYTQKKSQHCGWVDPLSFLRNHRAPGSTQPAPPTPIPSPSLGQEFPITTGLSLVGPPAISGQIVVWSGWHSSRYTDIWGYDLSAKREFPICTADDDQETPQISGNTVVWTDYREGLSDIWAYNLGTRTEFPVCTASRSQWQPDVDGNLIVWRDERRDPNGDIWGYDISTGTEFPISAVDGFQGTPKVSGNYVVWDDGRVSIADRSLYAYDIRRKIEFEIPYATGPLQDLSGNLVVWLSQGAFPHICVYDLSKRSLTSIPSGNYVQDSVAISGSLLAWRDCRNAYGGSNLSDIYCYELRSRTELRVTTNEDNQSSPAVSGSTIVWKDSRNDEVNIWGMTLNGMK